MEKFYITTTLPYVNAPPHMGFALEAVQADIVARSRRLAGGEVFFNTGTDEHGLKIYRQALAEKRSAQDYVDEYADKFKKLMTALNVGYDYFSRTTDQRHVKAAQEFWKRCAQNGYIEKKLYKIKYCVGCELEKTESELKNGLCPLHPNLIPETIEEGNYFFKLSKFQKLLLALYEKYPDFVLPRGRFSEIKKFVASGLRDFSISRLKDKMPWGIPVPGDASQVMYVWFDALVNYISALGWPSDMKTFDKFWGTNDEPRALQFAGKDNLRQQAAMWQAMLLAAGLPTSRQIVIHGFITSGGEKMSKSLGNIADPMEIINKHGADALRYWLAREIPAFEDGDFTYEKFKERYNGDLANGLGNFASRVLTLGSSISEFSAALKPEDEIVRHIEVAKERVETKMEKFEFHEALAAIWELAAFGDSYVQRTEPWDIENKEKKARAIFNLVVILDNIAALLRPFLPAMSDKITKCIEWDDRLTIKKCGALFPRIK